MIGKLKETQNDKLPYVIGVGDYRKREKAEMPDAILHEMHDGPKYLGLSRRPNITYEVPQIMRYLKKNNFDSLIDIYIVKVNGDYYLQFFDISLVKIGGKHTLTDCILLILEEIHKIKQEI